MEPLSTNFLSKNGGRHLGGTPGTCNDYQRETAKSVGEVFRELV